MSHNAENDVLDQCLRCHGDHGWYGLFGVWEPCPDCDPMPNAENDRTPHTHGGTDAPECTPYGVTCRPAEIDVLAQAIRVADGNHDLGAGALAEALMPTVKALMAQAWDQGRAAERRDWEFTADLSTPDEDRQPLPNPYRVIPPARCSRCFHRAHGGEVCQDTSVMDACGCLIPPGKGGSDA